MFARHIGIDLGTANVLVYVKGRGIVLNEPSVVAISNSDNRLVAVGNEARAMLGRTPGSITVSRPMRDGVIADYVITEAMLRYFITKVTGRFRMFKPTVMVCIPAGVTSVEQRAVHDATIQAGAKYAHLIEEPLAAAIGAKVPIHLPSGNMVVDIGGGTTEAAVVSLNGVVVSSSVRVAGNKMDEAIAAYIKKKYNLMIGDGTAEAIKMQIGSALPLEEEVSIEVRGRDNVAGLPKTITVRSVEVREAISEPLAAIIQAVKSVLEQTPPELASDVIDKGMVLTGGGALLRNLDRLLAQETGVPCYVAEDPLSCVAVGAGLALERIEILRRNLPSMEN
ncbi:MAG: rod shape-determining protein [Dehalococcoidales bacterium]|nr:rod shape-determining protein [Dehalococcoidales bacterium]